MREYIQRRIDEAVFRIYSSFSRIKFPTNLSDVIALFPNCRRMTYDELGMASGKSHEEIVNACGSYDGTTRLDVGSGRFLILVNDSKRNGLIEERIRWTGAHELGHIICGHFDELPVSGKAEVQSSELSGNEMEEEADCFAASLLAPIPAMCRIGVRDVRDIRKGFGLSQRAAEYRWVEFNRFLETADTSVFAQEPSLWRLFREREILSPIPYHFFRKAKMPTLKSIDVTPPDTEI